jgi:1-acyl-sn-glycerol-3-phosphate acyltransferase
MPASWHCGWRVLATALAFGSFGAGGLLLGLLYFPMLGLCVRHPGRRVELARRAVQIVFGLFIRLMRSLRLISYEIHGQEALERQGLLILANHPTLIDVVFLISLVRNADCVVRAGLADNPFTAGPVRATRYIRNEGGAELLQLCIASLRSGGNLVIFPEGTRSRPDEPLQMQRGAAQIATRGGFDVTPVSIRCEPPGLSKGRPWWQVAACPLHFTIRVGEDITVAPFLERAAGEPALAARYLTAYLRAFFSDEIEWIHAGPRA